MQAILVGAPAPPDAKLEATKSSLLLVEFTKPMMFPDNLLDLIRDGQLSKDHLFKLELFPFDGDESFSRLLQWTLVEVSPNSIKIKLEFSDPLEVSQGSEPDSLFVQIMLHAYLDIDGLHLPKNLVRRVVLPKQFASESEKTTLNAIKDNLSVSASSIFTGNGFLTFVLNVSANQLWSALNSL